MSKRKLIEDAGQRVSVYIYQSKSNFNNRTILGLPGQNFRFGENNRSIKG